MYTNRAAGAERDGDGDDDDDGDDNDRAGGLIDGRGHGLAALSLDETNVGHWVEERTRRSPLSHLTSRSNRIDPTETSFLISDRALPGSLSIRPIHTPTNASLDGLILVYLGPR